MKKIHIKLFIQTIVFSLILNYCYSQSDISGLIGVGHQGASNTTYFVGWDANTTFPLNIRHDATGSGAQDIDFYTNGGQKMTIRGTNSTDNGFVGIATASPSSVLHIAT